MWLEFVPSDYIESVQFYPNIAEAALTVKKYSKNTAFCVAGYCTGFSGGKKSMQLSRGTGGTSIDA